VEEDEFDEDPMSDEENDAMAELWFQRIANGPDI
jgi:hypothetical protein